MRVKNFDYFRWGSVILYFLVGCAKATAIKERTWAYFDDDFAHITVLQSNNQKFTIYRDAIKHACYIEAISVQTQKPNRQPNSRNSFLENIKITLADPMYKKFDQDVFDFCKNYPIFTLENDFSSRKLRREKRQTMPQKKPYFKGQTQTQFISFNNEGKEDKGGTAEATAEQDKSRATVQGRLGMGQAQSQSGSGDPCDECAGSVRSTGIHGSAYPSTSYPTGQGSNIPGGWLYPSPQPQSGAGYSSGNQYPSGAALGPTLPAGVQSLGGGQNQPVSGTYPSSNNVRPGTSGIPNSLRTDSTNSQGSTSGYPLTQNGAGGYFLGQPFGPSQTGTLGSDGMQRGASTYPQGYGQGGTNIGAGRPGYVPQGTSNSFSPSGGLQNGGKSSYNHQTGPGNAGQPGTESSVSGGSPYLPQQGYTPTVGIESGRTQGQGVQTGGFQSGGQPSYGPQAGFGGGSQLGTGGSPYLPQQGHTPTTGINSGQPQGQGAPSRGFQSGGQPSYGPQEPGTGSPVNRESLYSPQKGFTSTTGVGGTSYPPGYVPQSNTGVGGSQEGLFYPQTTGYAPSSASPPGGVFYQPHPAYISQLGESGSQGGNTLYPQQPGSGPQGAGINNIPGSGVSQGNGVYPPPQQYILQGGATGGTYPQQRYPLQGNSEISQPGLNQFQSGGAAYPQQSSHFPQGSTLGLPYNLQLTNVPQSGTGNAAYPQQRYSPQGAGSSYPQSTGQTLQGVNSQLGGQSRGDLVPGGGIYPQSGAGPYPQPGATAEQGGGTYPQPGATIGSGGGIYPLPGAAAGLESGTYPQPGRSEGGIYPQLGAGGGVYPPPETATGPGSGIYPQSGATTVPGGGTYPSVIGGGFYPQIGTASTPQGGTYPQGGATSPQTSGSFYQPQPAGLVYPPGTSFIPQSTPIGQTNTNYPGSYPYTPEGQDLSSSVTNTNQIQGGAKGVDVSFGSQITPIDTASGESQSLSSLNIHPNGTNAAASAQGKTRNGMAQAQVSGTYTGSFSAQAQTSDNEKSVQTQIFGNTTSASSSSQGKAGKSESQSQIQYNYNTGATLAESQGSGINYNTNTQIQVGNRGGIADAQSTGSGSTSSQAQIGFLPPDNKRKEQTALFEGGGTSSSQNSANSGQSQTQLQGSFRSGTSFIGSAQSSSGKVQNKTKLAFDSSDLSFPSDDAMKLPPNPEAEQSAKQIKKENGIVKSTVPLSSLPQGDQKDNTKHTVSNSEPPQHQDAIIKSQKYDAYIDRDSSDMKTFNAGDLIPGTNDYRIPIGFRGKVASTAGDTTHATATSLGHAQTQTVLLKPGKGRVTINNRHRSDQSNLQNDANSLSDKNNAYDEYVTVTKSETGELGDDKKFAHTYYTKSSTCGYFTFTCNYIDGSNGRTKICKPGPLTYSDGTPCS